MTQLKNYCPLPFGHTSIGDNKEFKVCCLHRTPTEHKKTVDEHSHHSWFFGEYIQEVRDYFKKDLRHPGCNNCWKMEDLGFTSLRQQQLKEYKILKVDTDNPKLLELDIQIGNICNLGCLMCDPRSSSYINAENKKLDLENINQKDYKFSDDYIEKILSIIVEKNVKVINIRGGETFYSKDIFNLLEMIDNEKKQQLVLNIVTNATIWNKKWQLLLEKFKLVRFMFSVDATNELYNYIRFPGEWHQTKKNILEIIKMPNSKFLINTVVQNLNIMNLKSLVEFANSNSIHLTLDTILRPNYLQITNLPNDKVVVAIRRLNEIKKMNLLQKNLYHDIDKLIGSLNLRLQKGIDENLWQQFLFFINKKDQHRGKNVWDYLV